MARVRIKGRKASVLRFFSISVGCHIRRSRAAARESTRWRHLHPPTQVSYTILWIMLTSELGSYSRKFGPQVLLQLNLAYYLPSVPVLILSGHVERAMDEQFGRTKSMLLRLTTGLLGCAVICASFPFLPDSLAWLLGTTAVLGALRCSAAPSSQSSCCAPPGCCARQARRAGGLAGSSPLASRGFRRAQGRAPRDGPQPLPQARCQPSPTAPPTSWSRGSGRQTPSRWASAAWAAGPWCWPYTWRWAWWVAAAAPGGGPWWGRGGACSPSRRRPCLLPRARAAVLRRPPCKAWPLESASGGWQGGEKGRRAHAGRGALTAAAAAAGRRWARTSGGSGSACSR
jgi:hypothetical protein